MHKTQFSRLINVLSRRGTLILCVLGLQASSFAPALIVTPVAAKPMLAQTTKIPHACTEIGLSSLGAAAQTDLIWKNKSELRVRFMDGSPELQRHVRHYASMWNKYTGTPFVFVDSEPSDIRVAFIRNGRSWSYIGNSAERVSVRKPTINFGWFDDTTTEVVLRRTTLHEFGHALGLIHEHQSPRASIKWNKPEVYKYYEEHFAWNENVVNDNIFQKYKRTQTQYGVYDPTSIMHYPIPAKFTTDGSYVDWNTNLSAMDIAFVRKIYP